MRTTRAVVFRGGLARNAVAKRLYVLLWPSYPRILPRTGESLEISANSSDRSAAKAELQGLMTHDRY